MTLTRLLWLMAASVFSTFFDNSYMGSDIGANSCRELHGEPLVGIALLKATNSGRKSALAARSPIKRLR